MTEVILNYLVLYILLEIYEVSWQKAHTLMGMFVRMYAQYTKSIFIFLLMHPTFYFSLWFVMLSDYNMYAMILLFIKTADLATKILLIEQIFIKKELTHEVTILLLSPVNKLFPYIGVLFYPPLVALTLF